MSEAIPFFTPIELVMMLRRLLFAFPAVRVVQTVLTDAKLPGSILIEIMRLSREASFVVGFVVKVVVVGAR